MRIVSLEPGATDICHVLGLADEVVGVSQDCDGPEEIRDRPVLNTSANSSDHESGDDIHGQAAARENEGRSLHHVDEERLRNLNPDLILTEERCDVCASSYDVEEKAGNESTEIVTLEPECLSDILENITRIGSITGTADRAKMLVSDLQDRIEFIENTADPDPSPRVLCLERIDPPYLPGHWVPEMVEKVGATPMNRPGIRSRQAEWAALNVFQPNLVILMPRGFDPGRTQEEVDQLDALHQLFYLDPVQEGDVYNVNGPIYFHRPGPRAITGLEILAKLIAPDRYEELTIPEEATAKLSVPV